jgi:uncharacterized protein
MQMTRKRFSLALLACFVLLSSASFGQSKTHRVVFGLTSTDESDWKLTMHNIRSLLKALAPEPVEIEVVAYGPGINFLKADTPELSDIKEFQAQHVHFMACANAMKGAHLTQADLIPGAEVVPAGIAEVVKKQEEGWTYIKAGK